MKKMIAAITAAAVAVTALGAGLAPANAASPSWQNAQLLQVQYHGRQDGRYDRRPVFAPHGDYALYNGHRGYRHRHAGYRYYNGYWFPPAAFVGAAIGGAILGGILNNAR